MPTYDYECQSCGNIFEVFQSISAPKLKKCPRCRGKLKRLLGTGAGIIFKGSGFYATDYRSPSYLEGAKKEKGPAAGASEKPAAKDAGKAAKPADSD